MWHQAKSLVLLTLSFGVIGFSADKTIVSPPGTKPSGNYSQGILADGTLYISGQGSEDASGRIPNDFDAEVRQSVDNVAAVLTAAGMSPANVVSVQVYLLTPGTSNV